MFGADVGYKLAGDFSSDVGIYIWPHSGEKRSKLRTGHPSNPSFRSELTTVHSWYM